MTAVNEIVEELARECAYRNCDEGLAWRDIQRIYCSDSCKALEWRYRKADELGMSIERFNRIYINKTEEKPEGVPT